MDEDPGSTKEEQRSPLDDILLGAFYGDAFAGMIAGGVYLLNAFTDYGWAFFFALPCFAGLVCGTFMRKRGHDVGRLAVSSTIATVVPCAILFFSQIEGAMCIVMAFPLIFLAHLFCGLLGGAIAGANSGWPLRVSFLVLAPFVLASESWIPAEPSVYTVTTTVLVKASPERIWPYLSNLESIPPNNNVLFRAGIAHPISTRTIGQGIGAQRLCKLSTGEMNERVIAWAPGRRLAFEVLNTPPTMKEWNPFGPVHAAHLTGYYHCRTGEFILKPIAKDKTMIIGTSTYDHRFGPSWYWSLWTDYVVRGVHASVLEEIKARAESGNS